MHRRHFLKTVIGAAALGAISTCTRRAGADKPNIILLMADDLGWGDVGFHGHPVLQTPSIDDMASKGLRFDRFYSAAPVCSPTRGSCLTGRHPFRYAVFTANSGHMKAEELTLAEALKKEGYHTGHFGKWHLGTLTETIRDSNRGGRVKGHYSPPWENGFDVCFSTEAKVPTCDPMLKPAGWSDQRWWNRIESAQASEPYNTRYWTGPGQFAEDNLAGDDSRVIMDRVIPFVRESARQNQPFFAVVWFHAPHWPVVAEREFRNLYAGLDDFSQNHFGCITAMDEQIGRLRKELEALGVEKDTMIWFCSDNGPEGTKEPGPRHGVGSAGPFRGRKRDLYEGGIRVPGLLYWPRKIKRGRITAFPASTSDFAPTIFNILDLPFDGPSPLDGIGLAPVLFGTKERRDHPIAFEHRDRLALIDDRFKIVSYDDGATFELYDIIKDPGETTNLADLHQQRVKRMKEQLFAWRESCSNSRRGEDYL